MPNKILLNLFIFLMLSTVVSCGPSTADTPQTSTGDDTGTLKFLANGEDFVRQGFTSKDGWAITFDQVLVNLSQITAYQSDPPYHPDKMQADIEAKQIVQLSDTLVIDLAQGGESAAPINVAEITAPAGRYNALGWHMTPAASGNIEGYSLVMAGTAKKDGLTLPFTIGVEESYSNLCGEYVGDARKGILTPNGSADLEMTFHFDHIFGDAELPPDDSLNQLAPGFEPFALMAEDDQIETDLTALQKHLPADDYQTLLDILPTLGHTGEGHCFYGPQM